MAASQAPSKSRALSKASFFAAIERLDDSDDSQSEENSSFQTILAASRPSVSAPNATAGVLPSCIRDAPSLIRANTAPANTTVANAAPEPGVSSKKLNETETLIDLNPEQTLEKEKPAEKVRAVKRSHTTGNMPRSYRKGSAIMRMQRMLGKRKADTLKCVPEGNQVFKGLTFFFVPNNDIAPARRLRIQRAREYGAEWTREWGSHITHLIVEKGLTYQHIMDHLKLETFPKDIALVNEDYPPACIEFRSLLSPSYTRFQVVGTPVAIEKKEPAPPGEQEKTDSLTVKASRREKQTTPDRLQNSPEENTSAYHQVSKVVESEPSQDAELETEPRERDVLDDIIDESKATSHLPLDSDEEPADISDGESDLSEPEPAKKKKRTVPSSEGQAGPSWMQSFTCMQKFDPNASRDNPNVRTIEILQEMLDYYTRNADLWRTIAYRKAISTLRRQTKKITTKQEAFALPGIGQRLADKIEEIVRTNHLRRLDYANSSPEDLVIQEFLGIYGAGLTQATKWVSQGYRSLDDLRNKASLTPNQRIGVEHYHDFAQRIPRKEVEAHGAIVRRKVQTADKDMQAIISGSYRRGARDSGDIDVLITKPGASLDEIRSLVLDVIVPELFEEGFLQVGLATSHRHHSEGSKWHGASCIPGSKVWRRIDLLFVPGHELGAALLYFTGNDIFNRSMRLLARKNYMCLNQHGLFGNVLRGSDNEKTNPGRLLEALDERRIFSLLGVPWRKPEERIC